MNFVLHSACFPQSLTIRKHPLDVISNILLLLYLSRALFSIINAETAYFSQIFRIYAKPCADIFSEVLHMDRHMCRHMWKKSLEHLQSEDFPKPKRIQPTLFFLESTQRDERRCEIFEILKKYSLRQITLNLPNVINEGVRLSKIPKYWCLRSFTLNHFNVNNARLIIFNIERNIGYVRLRQNF